MVSFACTPDLSGLLEFTEISELDNSYGFLILVKQALAQRNRLTPVKYVLL